MSKAKRSDKKHLLKENEKTKKKNLNKNSIGKKRNIRGIDKEATDEGTANY